MSTVVYRRASYFAYDPDTIFYDGRIDLHIVSAMAVSAVGPHWNQLFRQYVGSGLGLAVPTGFGLPSREDARAAGSGTASANHYATILHADVSNGIFSSDSIACMSQDRIPPKASR